MCRLFLQCAAFMSRDGGPGLVKMRLTHVRQLRRTWVPF